MSIGAAQLFAAGLASNLAFAAIAPPAVAAYASVYSFKGGSDGQAPHSPLIGIDGAFYGTTSYGGGTGCGGQGCGTVYKVTPGGIETVLHSFASGSDGAIPIGNLINVGEVLFGTTSAGGGITSCGDTQGCGTVFMATLGGATTILHSFGNGIDGNSPMVGLVNHRGTLYGTTTQGGKFGNGSVFMITQAGSEQVLYSFDDSRRHKRNAAYPTSGLLEVKEILYTTTAYGGPNNGGTAFSISRAGKFDILHNFGSGKDATFPDGGLINVNGTLYGTTVFGGNTDQGTVFSLAPGRVESVLYSFAGGSDGSGPVAALTDVNGVLYGTTRSGGGTGCDELGCGTVFKMTSSGVVTILYSFAGGNDGNTPAANLVKVGGKLYGTTINGGRYGYGTVFWIAP